MIQIIPMEQWVALYVWQSTPSRGMAGHASIQTFGDDAKYMSWWPGDSYYGGLPDATRTFAKDCAEENKNPEEIIIFCSLNKVQIHGTFKYLRSQNAQYNVLGKHSILTKFAPEPTILHNCTSMAATLLNAGGGACTNFVSICLERAGKNGTITPALIATIAKERKPSEIDLVPKQYPEFSSFYNTPNNPYLPLPPNSLSNNASYSN